MKRIREKDNADISIGDPDTHEDVTSGESSTMGWVTLPFRAFVRGFRESLKRA